MEFEFDKEIDSLLRRTAKSGDIFAPKTVLAEHIDADEISMFAENALPVAVRPRVMKHLANCDRCRTILSNVSVLNSEAEAAKASALSENENAGTVVAAAKVPWYQKLFSTRHLAFGMGALALIFAVGIGFLVVQNSMLDATGEMAQANTNTEAANSADMQTAPLADQTAANSNSVANADTNSAEANTMSPPAADSNAATADSKGPAGETRSEPGADEDFAEVPPPPPGRADLSREKPRDNSGAVDDAEVETAETVTEEKDVSKEDKPAVATTDSVSAGAARNQPSPTTPRSSGATVAKPKKSVDKDEAAEAKRKSGESSAAKRKINGKTFNRRDGVWYDSAYKNQTTTNVRRGTSTYRKLDKGLQSIGNQLSGTVVVVWKSKGYKIQ
jgi:hypothetical protein